MERHPRPSTESEVLGAFLDGFREEIETLRQGGDADAGSRALTGPEQVALSSFFDGVTEEITNTRFGDGSSQDA